MGLASGSVSISRYQILPPPTVSGGAEKSPWGSWGQLNRLLDPYKAPPLVLDKKISPEVAGWVYPVSLQGTSSPSGGGSIDPQSDLGLDHAHDRSDDHPWDMEMCQVDEALLLRLRLERRQVPNQLLQMLYKKEIFQMIQKTGHSPSPKEKRQLKQDLTHQLTKRALPAIQFVDGLWWQDARELWVITTSKKLRGLFVETFSKTFLAPVSACIVEIAAPLVGLKAMGDFQKPESIVATEALRLLSSTVPVSIAHP